jgi:hypothetical protein
LVDPVFEIDRSAAVNRWDQVINIAVVITAAVPDLTRRSAIKLNA